MCVCVCVCVCERDGDAHIQTYTHPFSSRAINRTGEQLEWQVRHTHTLTHTQCIAMRIDSHCFFLLLILSLAPRPLPPPSFIESTPGHFLSQSFLPQQEFFFFFISYFFIFFSSFFANLQLISGASISFTKKKKEKG